jgi:hypothetical protein
LLHSGGREGFFARLHRDLQQSTGWLVQWGAPETDARATRRILEQQCRQRARREAQQEQS